MRRIRLSEQRLPQIPYLRIGRGCGIILSDVSPFFLFSVQDETKTDGNGVRS